MTKEAFMKVIEYVRSKHGVTIQRLCDDIGVKKKDYEYYVSGIKTMPPQTVLEIIKYFGVEEF